MTLLITSLIIATALAIYFSYKYSQFSVEHYPLTGRYYAKRGKGYINKNATTGIYELYRPFLFGYCDSFKTEEEAVKCIELYKEQQLKVNVTRKRV